MKRHWRIFAMPAFIGVVAGVIWFVNRTPEEPGKKPPAGDAARVKDLIEKGRRALEKAKDGDAALDAVRHFHDAITVDGENLDAREGAAEAGALAGSLAQAQDNAVFVLKRAPDRRKARELLAVINWRIAFGRDAHVLPRKPAVFKTTRDPAAPPEAATHRKALAAALEGLEAYMPLKVAEDHFRAGRLDQAQKVAESADLRYAETSLMLGVIALEAGRDAAPFLKAAARRGLSAARMLSARLAVETGDWETAYREAKSVTDYDPTSKWVDAWIYQGIAAKRLGRAKEAEQAFEYVRKADPSAEAWLPKE